LLSFCRRVSGGCCPTPSGVKQPLQIFNFFANLASSARSSASVSHTSLARGLWSVGGSAFGWSATSFLGWKTVFFCRGDVVRGRTETVPSNSRPRHWCFAGRSGSAAARERDCSERTGDVFRYHIGPTVFAIHPRRSNSACQQSRSNPPPGVRADGEELKALGELRSYITRIRKPSRLHVHLYWAFFNTSSALVFEWPIAMGRTD
jgi:hypothetical protein